MLKGLKIIIRADTTSYNSALTIGVDYEDEDNEYNDEEEEQSQSSDELEDEEESDNDDEELSILGLLRYN